MANYNINNIAYVSRIDSDVKLVEIPQEGQTPIKESQEAIERRSYELSSRNGANNYMIQTEKERVYLNFIGQKVIVSDQDFNSIISPEFEYFIDEDIVGEAPFIIADGVFFRCASANSAPKAKEDYQYYIMMNGKAKAIPDYKTLEVMLAERNQNLNSVRVIEEGECQDLEQDQPIQSKANLWKEEYSDQTNLEALAQLENNAQQAETIAAQAREEAATQIAAVQAQAEASAAEAAAAQAQAEQARAEAEAAIAQAESENGD